MVSLSIPPVLNQMRRIEEWRIDNKDQRLGNESDNTEGVAETFL